MLRMVLLCLQLNPNQVIYYSSKRCSQSIGTKTKITDQNSHGVGCWYRQGSRSGGYLDKVVILFKLDNVLADVILRSTLSQFLPGTIPYIQ